MKISNAIIVPCHACFNAEVTSVPDNPLLDTYWSLFPYQKGEIQYYAEHIQKGLELARSDVHSLLIFSGGSVREGIGDWTEAESYFEFAKWLSRNDSELLNILHTRTYWEKHASNSFQNLLFSLLSYRLHFQLFPEKHDFPYPGEITTVGWDIKQERFLDHASAIGLDLNHFFYVSVNTIPGDIEFHLAREAKTRELFKRNLYGIGDEFSSLRSNRKELFSAQYYKDNLDDEHVASLLSFIENPKNASAALPEFLNGWYL